MWILWICGFCGYVDFVGMWILKDMPTRKNVCWYAYQFLERAACTFSKHKRHNDG